MGRSGKKAPPKVAQELLRQLPKFVVPRDVQDVEAAFKVLAMAPHRTFNMGMRQLLLSWHFSFALALLGWRLRLRKSVASDDLNGCVGPGSCHLATGQSATTPITIPPHGPGL